MLHLFPLRLLAISVFAIVGLAVLTAMYADVLGNGNMMTDALAVVRWASFAVIPLTILAYGTWRWIPGVQQLIFPYLGGEWSGKLYYESDGQECSKIVGLDILHNLFRIKLVLESDESRSETLVVHCERDLDFNKKNRIYYVFENKRKEGKRHDGSTYKGLATMIIEKSESMKLCGDYFTEHNRCGRLELERKKHNSWWMLWR